MLDSTTAVQSDIIDPRELRRALGRFATGVTIVTTRDADCKAHGLTANSFTSVSLDPPLVLWSLARSAGSMPAFMAAEWFAVHVLASEHRALSGHFATKSADKFTGLDLPDGLGGCPVLHDALARFECSVHARVEAGDHVIFIGRVERMAHRDGEPLLYSGGRYCVPTELG